MNELTVFENSEFGSIRTVEIDGKPYFVASDVAKAWDMSMTGTQFQDIAGGS